MGAVLCCDGGGYCCDDLTIAEEQDPAVQALSPNAELSKKGKKLFAINPEISNEDAKRFSSSEPILESAKEKEKQNEAERQVLVEKEARTTIKLESSMIELGKWKLDFYARRTLVPLLSSNPGTAPFPIEIRSSFSEWILCQSRAELTGVREACAGFKNYFGRNAVYQIGYVTLNGCLELVLAVENTQLDQIVPSSGGMAEAWSHIFSSSNPASPFASASALNNNNNNSSHHQRQQQQHQDPAALAHYFIGSGSGEKSKNEEGEGNQEEGEEEEEMKTPEKNQRPSSSNTTAVNSPNPAATATSAAEAAAGGEGGGRAAAAGKEDIEAEIDSFLVSPVLSPTQREEQEERKKRFLSIMNKNSNSNSNKKKKNVVAGTSKRRHQMHLEEVAFSIIPSLRQQVLMIHNEGGSSKRIRDNNNNNNSSNTSNNRSTSRERKEQENNNNNSENNNNNDFILHEGDSLEGENLELILGKYRGEQGQKTLAAKYRSVLGINLFERQTAAGENQKQQQEQYEIQNRESQNKVRFYRLADFLSKLTPTEMQILRPHLQEALKQLNPLSKRQQQQQQNNNNSSSPAGATHASSSSSSSSSSPALSSPGLASSSSSEPEWDRWFFTCMLCMKKSLVEIETTGKNRFRGIRISGVECASSHRHFLCYSCVTKKIQEQTKKQQRALQGLQAQTVQQELPLFLKCPICWRVAQGACCVFDFEAGVHEQVLSDWKSMIPPVSNKKVLPFRANPVLFTNMFSTERKTSQSAQYNKKANSAERHAFRIREHLQLKCTQCDYPSCSWSGRMHISCPRCEHDFCFCFADLPCANHQDPSSTAALHFFAKQRIDPAKTLFISPQLFFQETTKFLMERVLFYLESSNLERGTFLVNEILELVKWDLANAGIWPLLREWTIVPDSHVRKSSIEETEEEDDEDEDDVGNHTNAGTFGGGLGAGYRGPPPPDFWSQQQNDNSPHQSSSTNASPVLPLSSSVGKYILSNSESKQEAEQEQEQERINLHALLNKPASFTTSSSLSSSSSSSSKKKKDQQQQQEVHPSLDEILHDHDL